MVRARSLTLALLVAAAASACGVGDTPRDPAPPSIVLVSIDTVRADELSVYGGPEGATPILDALASRATRFAECVSSAPWTMPSHASMFTGLYPFEHGAHTFLPGPDHRGDNVFALHARFETLAERLAREGYRTGGVVSNSIYLRPQLGLEAGFDTWDVKRDAGPAVTDRALAWLDENRRGDRPVFLFVNYMDAHRPYATGDPDEDARGELDALIERVMDRGEPPGARGERVRDMHQRAVTRLDAELGRLFDGLRERGLFEPSILVVTSDHGEAFGEHGVVEHSKDVYEELVRVPLIVKAPSQGQPAVVADRASSVDVPGIVAAELVAAGHDILPGEFPRRPGGHFVLAENHYSRFGDLARFGERFARRRYAIYEGRWKLIAGSKGSVELYDLDADPGETADVSGLHGDVVERLASELERALSETAFEGERALPGQLTPEQRQDMGELGYGANDGR